MSQIKKLYYALEEALTDYDLNSSTAKTGRNKQVKADAKGICEDAIIKARNLIFQNEELFTIWDKTFPPSNPFARENFFAHKGFSSDMHEYLNNLKKEHSIY